MDILKGCHVACGSIFVGSLLLFYLNFVSAIKSGDLAFLKRLIVISLWVDGMSLLALALAVSTGTFLVGVKHYSFQVHWIQDAYFLALLSFLLWLFLVLIKLKNYRSIHSGNYSAFSFRYFFHPFHWIIFLSSVLIIHDAVEKSSLLAVIFS